jgi:adenylate cyclase
MFSSYVSKKVVDELIKDPERAKVGGERRNITILFVDIRGFTSYQRVPRRGDGSHHRA